MKKLIVSLCILFGIPVFASVPTVQDSYSDQFVEATLNPLIEEFNPCSCISYAKWRMGVSQAISWGNANQIVPSSLIPAPQGIVILNEGPYSHVAHYTLNGAFLSVDEYNYIPCQYSERTIYTSDPRIKGYK